MRFLTVFSFWKCHQYFFIDRMSTFPLIAAWTSQMWIEIMRQNVHISLKSWLDIANLSKKSCDKTSAFCWAGGRISWMSKNHGKKRPHFAEKPAGHRKRVGKIPVIKCPHVAKQSAGHHKWVQKFCDKPSKFRFRKGWTCCNRAFWGGWTLCHN